MNGEDTQYPTLVTVKEEKFDFEEADVYGHNPFSQEEEKAFEPPKRGRTRSMSKKTPTDKVDIKAKLERSRQSARECRARKKLRYQYLEEVISETEKSIFSLRRELDMLKIWAKELDEGRLPENLIQYRTSCVEKKLTTPFTLQQHHHAQIAQQRQATTLSQLSQSPNSALGTGGGLCVSPSTSASVGFAGLSLSPTGSLTNPYINVVTLGRLKQSPTNLSPTSAASGTSISPP